MASQHPEESSILSRLHDVSADHGLPALQERLLRLHALVQQPLAEVEKQLQAFVVGDRWIQKGARQLIAQQGKRLRPLCVILASRVGDPNVALVHELAVAVELVHSATLLHDDVVDMATDRRGAPATRVVYGNTLSIFAGDWLLIEAVRRVGKTKLPGLSDRLLDVITQMIEAEALQLELRATFNIRREFYSKIIEGKTAALFRWAMEAGGQAGGLDEQGFAALGQYGHHLGLAFQIMDDLLDLVGDQRATGKKLMRDVAEGKMTLPLIFASEADPQLAPWLQQRLHLDAQQEDFSTEDVAFLQGVLTKTGSLQKCEQEIQRHIGQAMAAIASLPQNAATGWLMEVAAQSAQRSS